MPDPLLPFGEYRPDVSDYEGIASQAVTNVVARGDGYGPFQDFQAFTQTLPGPCRGFFAARKSDGSIVIFAATSTNIYELNNSTFGWTNVSLSGGPYSALSSGANWQFAQFGSLVFATQANVVLQVFTLGSSSAFANNTGSPPQAAYIAVVGQFLVLSGLNSTPYRIQWSGLGDTTNWTAGVNQSDFQDFADGGLVRQVAGGEYGVIFQDTTIRQMTYAPGSAYIFQITRVCEDQGLFAPYAVARAGANIIFPSAQGFQLLQPGLLPEPIGKERVDRSFFAEVDTSNPQLIIAANDPSSPRVFFAFKSNNGSTGLFDTILVYDYVLDRWVGLSISGQYLATLAKPGLTLENLDVAATTTIAVSNAVAGDNDTFTKVLLHLDGTNGSTTITDSNAGGSAHTWTAHGSAAISTAQSKFGGASLLVSAATSDYVDTPNSSDFALGTGDFTIDLWFNITGGDGTDVCLAGQIGTNRVFYIQRSHSAGDVISAQVSGSNTITINGVTTFTSTSHTGWHHVALVRHGNVFTLYIDGVAEATATAANTVNTDTSTLEVGAVTAFGQYFSGYIDEFRLSVGVARWTANFTPPLQAYGQIRLTIATENLPVMVPAVDGASQPTVLTSGMSIDVANVGGTTEANAEGWIITVIDSTHIDLQQSKFVNAYTSGGVVAGPIDAMAVSFDSYPSIAGQPGLGAVNSANALGFFSGPNLQATLESAEKGDLGTRIFISGFRPVTDAQTVFGSLSTRENLQATRVYTAENPINSQGLIPMRASTRYSRGKIRIPYGTSWTFAMGVEPETITDGAR